MAGELASWRRFLTGRLEFRALALIVALGGAILAFFGLSDEVGEGASKAFDQAILLSLRNPADLAEPIGSRAFQETARDVTALGGFTLLTLIVVMTCACLLFFGRRRPAVVL